MWSQKLDAIILVGPFHLRIFYNSMNRSAWLPLTLRKCKMLSEVLCETARGFFLSSFVFKTVHSNTVCVFLLYREDNTRGSVLKEDI